MRINLISIIFFFSLINTPLAKTIKVQNFWASFSGHRHELSAKQKKTELKLLKGYAPCQGQLIVKKRSKWKCEIVSPDFFKCKANYSCKYVTRIFNHTSEASRIKRVLRKIKNKVPRFNIVVTDKEPIFKKKESGELPEKEIVAKRKFDVNRDRSFLPQRLAGFSIKKKPKKTRKKLISSKEKIEELELADNEMSDLEALKEDLEFEKAKRIKKEDVWSVTDSSVSDDGEVTYIVKPTKYTDDFLYKSELVLKSFGTSWLVAKDSSGNALSTFDFAWTPYYWKSSWLGFRGHFGGHLFATNRVVESEPKEETFLITEFSGYVDLRYKSIYLEMGVGFQKWLDETGGTYSVFSLGGGYSFVHRKFKYIDRVLFSYNTISTEDSYQEVKFGIGLTF
jgi:hypothetical protein